MYKEKLTMAMEKCSSVKRAEGVGVAGDVVAGMPASALISALPGVGPVAASKMGLAYLAGLASQPDNRQKKMWPAFFPGVGSYRLGNRIKTQVMRELAAIKENEGDKDARPVAHAVAEHIGSPIALLSAIGAGAGIGAAAGGKKGAIKGGASGAALAVAGHLAAAIAAAVKRRRTAREQIEADKGSLLAKYVVPGLADYGLLKRLGRSQGERDEAEANGNAEKKASATWDQVKEQIGKYAGRARDWYGQQNAVTKALLSTGGGAIGGAAISKLFGGKAGRGAALGALAGGASRIDWGSLLKALDDAQTDGQGSGK